MTVLSRIEDLTPTILRLVRWRHNNCHTYSLIAKNEFGDFTTSTE